MPAKTQHMSPKFVRGSSPEDLMKAMIRNNLTNAYEYSYFDIGMQGKEWFAWYLADVSNLIKIRMTADD